MVLKKKGPKEILLMVLPTSLADDAMPCRCDALPWWCDALPMMR